jgi:hypothetical protein
VVVGIGKLLPPHLRRPLTPLAVVTLALLIAVLAFRWWDRYVEDGLGRWAVGEVARRTGGAYRLVLSDLSFLPLAGSLSFDSAVVTTDSARNRRRKTPLPGLSWRSYGCRVSGLDLPRLLLRRSFVARELGCRRVVTGLALVSGDGAERRPRPASGSAGPAATVEELTRPLGLSSFRIAHVSLPGLGLTLTGLGERGGTSVLLEHARFHATDLVFDPAADSGSHRPLSAERARLSATGLIVRLDTLSEIAIAGIEADLTDSTLWLAGAKHEPRIPENEWVRRLEFRRDRIRFELDSLQARGVDWRALVASGEIGVRALELSRPRLDVLSDWRLPRGRPSHHPTPQQMAAAHVPALRLDSMVVTGGTIVYRERRAGRDRPGPVSFDSLRATVLHLDLPSQGHPLRIEVAARLMNEGLLTADASVPLDAPDFRYRLSGRLGSMSATAFNRILSPNEDYELERGWIEAVTFRQSARGGRVVTTLTPRYYDLSARPTGTGGGLLGSVKRGIEKFVINAFKLRSRNPDDGGDLRTARTARRYDPASGWLHFLWLTLRDGMMETIKE